MTTKATLALALPLLALFACGGEAEQDTPEAEAAATVAAVPKPPATVAAAAIPPRFIGVWDAETGTCDPASDLRLDITPQAIGFYESQGTLTRLADGPDGEAMLDLAMEGEGDQWDMTMTLRLTGAGSAERLIVQHKAEAGEPAPASLTLKRCPG